VVSVLQDWVMELPLRAQGTLLTGIRGCDEAPKEWDANGVVIDTPARRLTAFMRYCIMNPHDAREIDVPGAFFQSDPCNSATFHASAFGHFPQHWYAHAMHVLEVIGYCHPDYVLRITCESLYKDMVKNLHLHPETRAQMMERLLEDRIATGKVVE
jgi:hypothetical protein